MFKDKVDRTPVLEYSSGKARCRSERSPFGIVSFAILGVVLVMRIVMTQIPLDAVPPRQDLMVIYCLGLLLAVALTAVSLIFASVGMTKDKNPEIGVLGFFLSVAGLLFFFFDMH